MAENPEIVTRDASSISEQEVVDSIFGVGTTTIPRIKFPLDSDNYPHQIVFRAYKFSKLDRQQAERTDCVAEIYLPMTSSLNTSYNASYDTPEAGPFMGNVVSAVDAKGSVGDAIARMLTKNPYGKSASIITALGLPVAEGLAGTFSALTGTDKPITLLTGAFGIARNPYRVVLYQGTDFRTHTFSWQLTPKSKRESDAITQIITAFKYYMSPSYGRNAGNALKQIAGAAPRALEYVASLASEGSVSEKSKQLKTPDTTEKFMKENLENVKNFFGDFATGVENIVEQGAFESRAFFDFPEVWRINLILNMRDNNRHMHKIGESVLTSFDVNYHPENYPAYVRSLSDNGLEAAPASITISLSFKETQIVTKESLSGFGDFQRVG